ncbi:SagB family peptide dehydrogenase [Gynuella sp.]|uniref:SagB family peptide dehydrogenase n=1 Tax=Gynuella sp. TaxID=2969146 RepID=UPI003D13ACEB
MKPLSDINQVLHYHEQSKHHTQQYAPGPGFLDWDSQPDPFRTWHGSSRIALPLIYESESPDYHGIYQQPPQLTPWNLGHLSQFLELAMGLSAWKVHGPERWALRNNPSSGNLHPTELYILLWRPISPNLPAGLFHYHPYHHALEQRAELSPASLATLNELYPDAHAALGFSSIIWREEWKYGSRAYRYCQLDIGHALGSCRYAAANFGWPLQLIPTPSDQDLAALLGLDRDQDFIDSEPELPECLALLGHHEQTCFDWSTITYCHWQGQASKISQERIHWPQIKQLLPAIQKPRQLEHIDYLPPAQIEGSSSASTYPLAQLIRHRRSAQRMDPDSEIPLEDFCRLLSHSQPSRQSPPFDAFTFEPAIDLLLFVHAVTGLAPGMYVFPRQEPSATTLLDVLRNTDITVEPVAGIDLPLFQIGPSRNVRKDIGRLCCHQGIAVHGAFAVSMLANIQTVLTHNGAWSWRRLMWEAGLIGQLLYLEAEASQLSGTGIGCFLDDEVLQTIGLTSQQNHGYQPLYHFTAGKAKIDTRIISEPAYAHLPTTPSSTGGPQR